MTGIVREVRTAIRSLQRSPGYAAVAIGSLALALGLVAAVFGFIDAFKNPRTATRRPEQLYTIRYQGDGASGRVTAAEHLAALEQHLTVAAGIAYYSWFEGPAIVGTQMAGTALGGLASFWTNRLLDA